jgi:hypothetical protein
MDDAHAFIKRLSNLRSQILAGIYPAVFSLHLYPELRDCAVQDALRPCRKKVQENTRMRVAKRRVIKRMSEMIVTETNRQVMIEAREILKRKE